MEKIALLFPGQGAQFVGMGKSLYDQHDLARHTFEEANDVLGCDLARICFEGSLSELSRAENAHPALLTVSVASMRIYMKELGVLPQFVAGHSLGEYAALTCAGGLRFPDAVRIVRYRAELAEDLATRGVGGMSVIEGVDHATLEATCREVSETGRFVAVSCYNAPHQADISGDQEAILEVEERVLERGGQVTPLFGSAPIHSPLMAEAASKLRQELLRCSFGALRYPVVANVSARLYQGSESIVENLIAHMLRPVQWERTLDYLQRKGVTMTVEMGAKNVLSSLTKLNTPSVRALCFGIREDRQTLADLLAAPAYRKHVPTVVTKCLVIGVATPNKNWDNDAYNEGVVQPYRRIQEIQAQLDREGCQPTPDEMRECLTLLKQILTTKQVDLAEQADWFDQIFDETATRYLFRDLDLSAAPR